MTDYFTDSSEILDNKLAIKDPKLLKMAEEDIVFLRLTELLHKPVEGAFDFAHLTAIHRHLFADLYWIAGQARTVDLAKENSVFCYARYIDSTQKQIFKRLEDDRYLRGLAQDQFVQKLVELSSDLNALHPFREGNGRAIRAFLVLLAQQAGYTLSFEKASVDALMKADIAAFGGNTQPLKKIYQKIIAPI